MSDSHDEFEHKYVWIVASIIGITVIVLGLGGLFGNM